MLVDKWTVCPIVTFTLPQVAICPQAECHGATALIGFILSITATREIRASRLIGRQSKHAAEVLHLHRAA